MALERLTQERVEKAKPGELLCDERITGLMLISQKRVKTWVAQREVKDADTGIRPASSSVTSPRLACRKRVM